ncbi:MAG: hypothetical protein KDA86_00225 [Planctomycetaceae bacterium]|nr:hypothetical protein [Planctomycetaceae bacterium]
MNSSAIPSVFNGLLNSRWIGRSRPWAAGVVCGTCLFVWSQQLLASFGLSLPVTGALTLTIAMGITVGWSLRAWVNSQPMGKFVPALAWLAISVWTVGFPWMLTLARAAIGRVPSSLLEVEATVFALLLINSFVLLMVPMTALTWIALGRAFAQPQRSRDRFPVSIRFVLGCGLALGTAPVLLASWLSVEQIGHMMTCLAAVAFWFSVTQVNAESEQCQSSCFGLLDVFIINRQHLRWLACASLLTGAVIPLVSRQILQFLPGSGFEFYAMFGGLVCGAACGLAWSERLLRKKDQTLSHDAILSASFIVAVWPAILLTLEPLLLRWNLALNASLETVPLLMAVRWSMVCLALFPLGVAVGRLCSCRFRSKQEAEIVVPVAVMLCVAAGIVLMRSLWPSLGLTMLFTTAAAITLTVVRLWKIEKLALRRIDWVRGAIAVALIGLFPLTIPSHRPDLTAKLLFSGQAFAAHNSGIQNELLPHIDDNRLLTVRDGRDAVWTAWKYRGSQIHLRRDGIPAGIVSTNTQACPQFPGDVVTAIAPLVVHPRPDRVLVVGLGSTAAVSTCLACPVRHVTCIEGDQDLIRISDEVITQASGFDPLNDDRLEVHHIDPTLALLSKGESYDVVIVEDAHPSLMKLTSRFTREFYESTARHLNPGGVVSQRLQYADFGREPIETILATLRSVFPQVVCLESAPGELVLLASNQSETLFDESLFERCQADHIRRLLAQQGWDWSVLVNLSAISPEQITKLASGDVVINTIGNGRFTYRLPQEVMRWGPKWRELANLFSERGSRMLAWIGESEEIPEIGKRLKDMSEQHRLIVEYPDRWHAYRSTLKTRLQERPRTKIMPVNHELERVLHPEDQRRKEYLKVLGEAATSDAPSTGEVERLAEFAEPYDPLVSYFLHEEAARLYDRSETPDRTAQLTHLLYSIHYSPGEDRSVRNVVAALQLLLDEPDLIADPHQRWDEMNSLLDVLRHRSSLRVQTDKTASSFELVDAEQSIQTAERAMDAMDVLSAEAGVAATDWEHRKTVLERMLVRPMWTYHSQQAQRLATIEARLDQTAEQAAESEAESTTTR